MRFLSVCSGIEAASVAWSPLGWKAVAFSEIEPFPCAVLAHHYHDTPNWGDMTKYKDWPDVSIDLLCGGTPCQSFSVAGLRKGLDDPRGNLMLTFGAIAAKYRPQWLVWENVPGVLSSNGGRDFGAFLGMLGQLGYGFAYKVCDAQYHGVAQRRRRVFVVGCLGDWHSAAAVLFERHSLQGHPAPRREKGKAAPTIPSRSTAGGGLGTDFDCDGGLVMPTMDQRAGRSGANSFATSGGLVPVPHAAISPALKARDNKGVSSDGDGDGAILVPMLAHSLRGGGFDASEDGTGRGTPLVPCVAGAMSASGGTQKKHGFGWGQQDWENGYCVPVAFDTTQITSPKNVSNPKPGDPCHPLAAGAHAPAIAFPANLSGTQCASTEDLAPRAETPEAVPSAGMQCEVSRERVLHQACAAGKARDSREGATEQERSGKGRVGETPFAVRRLTVEECEFLQGFPRGYSKIPWRKKPADQCPDGPRYKALGNSWAVPNVRWIGERIDAVALINKAQAATKDVAELEAA